MCEKLFILLVQKLVVTFENNTAGTQVGISLVKSETK